MINKNIKINLICYIPLENLHHAHGQYTDKTVKRAGKIVGSLSRDLDRAFAENITEIHTDDGYRKRKDYNHDVRFFITEYSKDKLFDYIPGRQHDSFPKFGYQTDIANPEQLKMRFLKYSKKLDRSRQVLY